MTRASRTTSTCRRRATRAGRRNVGDKVVVELREWKSRHTNPEGEIIEVLGAPDAEGVDMLSVLRQYNLPLHFPKRVLARGARHRRQRQARTNWPGAWIAAHTGSSPSIPTTPRTSTTRSACSAFRPSQWKLWVHIADVSHYVKPGTALDEEARKRGNSTYLVDRVIPMLPEALSNELCSLKPDVDRLTKCVEFLLVSNDGQVLSTQFYPAVIRSQRRFTYKEVFAAAPAPAARPHRADAPRRQRAGAEDPARCASRPARSTSTFPKRRSASTTAGRVLRIEKVENDVSHQLIEECMLLANEAVAGAADEPEPCRRSIASTSRRTNGGCRNTARKCSAITSPAATCRNRQEVQKLLQKLNTLPIGAGAEDRFPQVAHARALRGRAARPLRAGQEEIHALHLAHPPLRRPGGASRAVSAGSHGPTHSLKEIAEHISETERNSADAERDSRDVKMFAFLNAQLKSADPPRYPALVTDVRNFGFFVDVTGLGMSGLVPLSGVSDDFYHVRRRRAAIWSAGAPRRVFKLGDKVEVQVAKVDTFKKQVDFKLATNRAAGMVRPAKAPPAGRKFSPPRSSRPRRDFSRRSRRR